MNEKIDPNELNLGDIFILLGNFIKKQTYAKENISSLNKGRLYSSKEIANMYPFLKVHTLTELAENGKIPVTKIGKLNHFEEKDIIKYLNNQKVGDYSANNKYV